MDFLSGSHVLLHSGVVFLLSCVKHMSSGLVDSDESYRTMIETGLDRIII